MSDECLTKPCSMCGKRIQGVSSYCPNCRLCICFNCELRMLSKENYPVKCPRCKGKLR